MTHSSNTASAVSRWPVLWGGLASLAFYGLIHSGYLGGQFVLRYFANHPVEYITTTFFFVALAALVARLIDISGQTSTLNKVRLPGETDGRQTAGQCPALLTALDDLPRRVRGSLLGRRLRDALVLVHRKGNAETLDDQLRYLSEAEAVRAHESHALVRIIIWAIPILGFLGTVIGITLAVAKLTPDQLEQSLQQVTAGLGVAFDTTALSLALSIVLMFGQFLTSRVETRLLEQVDERAGDLLLGRFEQLGGEGDAQLAMMRRMAERMIAATEQVVERQADLWQTTIDAAHHRWDRLTAGAGKQVEGALTAALATGLKQHAETLARHEQSLGARQQDQWKAMQAVLEAHAAQVTRQQQELARQGEMMLQVVEATKHLANLEAALNRNLQVVAQSGNFTETVMTLSAAVNLLSARLGHDAVDLRRVEITSAKAKGNAA